MITIGFKQKAIDDLLIQLIENLRKDLERKVKRPVTFREASLSLAQYHMGLTVIEFDGRKKRNVLATLNLTL